MHRGEKDREHPDLGTVADKFFRRSARCIYAANCARVAAVKKAPVLAGSKKSFSRSQKHGSAVL